MSPAHEGQLLGELIVERGLMNDEQLEDALLEQRVSRKRLGAILVASGVISPPDLTAALMAQLGERTEAHPPRSVETAEPIGGGEDHHEPRRGGLLRRRRSVESRPAENGAAPVAGGTEKRPAKLDPATLELLRDFGAITQSHLADLRQEFEEAGKELEAARIELVARNERIAELEAFLERSDQERRQLAEALRDEITQTQSKLRVFRTAESAGGPEAEPRPKPAARSERADSPGRGYVLLVPDALGGHALRECAGEPPPVASQIEIGGHRFLVVSHRCSPIGSDNRFCVQLQIA
jgi:hypothetical protein